VPAPPKQSSTVQGTTAASHLQAPFGGLASSWRARAALIAALIRAQLAQYVRPVRMRFPQPFIWQNASVARRVMATV
jgi:hypothetical protein